MILHGRISCGIGTICAICRKILQPKMPPPHWTLWDWQEELMAIGWAAAWEAYHAFDPERCVPLEVFVLLRVKAALQDFCRRVDVH